MAVLYIDNSIRGKIREVIEYAEAHPTTLENLFQIAAGEKKPVGDDSYYHLIIPTYYRTVYSQEYQQDGRLYHHLSISVPGRDTGKCPSLPAVKMIMEEFGMGNSLEGCFPWLEDNAVNILKEIK